MKILKQGAEAIIYFDKLNSQEVLVKERTKKNYRLDQIDKKLRTNRTRQEMKLMREARGHGVLTPKIISSQEESFKIFMEHINGKLVKDSLNPKSFRKICFEVGANIGKLHSSGIIHGDLTTSNMITKNGKIYFIDFGLGQFSSKIEDMATDLRVLLETLRATHNKISEGSWESVKRGYKSQNKKAGEVFERMRKIEKRARYREKSG